MLPGIEVLKRIAYISMSIKAKISQKDYIKLSLKILLSQPVIWVFIIGYAAGLVSNIVSGWNKHFIQISLQLCFGFVFSGLIYFLFRNVYKNNPRAGELLEYKFNDDALSIAGESFSVEYQWNKIYRVTKDRNWLRIWHNKRLANAIPIAVVPNDELIRLKQILFVQNIKNNL